jgi:hypothetical protein
MLAIIKTVNTAKRLRDHQDGEPGNMDVAIIQMVKMEKWISRSSRR